MAKSNIIQTGKFEGLAETTADRIERQSKLAKTATEFPTKPVPIIESTARTGENCQGGMSLHFDAIDKCQHFATCGFCVDRSRISTSTTLKNRVVGIEDVFDTVAYMAKVPKNQRIAKYSN